MGICQSSPTAVETPAAAPVKDNKKTIVTLAERDKMVAEARATSLEFAASIRDSTEAAQKRADARARKIMRAAVTAAQLAVTLAEAHIEVFGETEAVTSRIAIAKAEADSIAKAETDAIHMAELDAIFAADEAAVKDNVPTIWIAFAVATLLRGL